MFTHILYTLPLVLLGVSGATAGNTIDKGITATSHGLSCSALRSAFTQHGADVVTLDWSASKAAGGLADCSLALSWTDSQSGIPYTQSLPDIEGTQATFAYSELGAQAFALAMIDSKVTQPAQSDWRNNAGALPHTFTVKVTGKLGNLQAATSVAVRNCVA